MPRSTRKGPFVKESLQKKVLRAKRGDIDEIKTWSRASMVTPDMVGLTIKVHNGRSHLFYIGPVENAVFKNFHFSAKVKTTPGSNSGIYFHTKYQQTGWPKKGYECQVNITHSDKKKSGGLYDAQNIFKQHANDDQWYTQEIIVRDKHIVTKIDGKVIVDYVEPEDVNFAKWPGRKLSSGTFAIQGHDPKSVVYFKDIKVKPL